MLSDGLILMDLIAMVSGFKRWKEVSREDIFPVL